MEKIIGEDEFKGLEAEIDSAVDRLFVEKEREREEGMIKKLTRSESSQEPVQKSDPEISSRASSRPHSPSKSEVEIETQSQEVEQKIDLESLIQPSSRPHSPSKSEVEIETQPQEAEQKIDLESFIRASSRPHSHLNLKWRSKNNPER